MPKFKCLVQYSCIIDADDEESAREKFFEDEVYDTQSDAETFIADNLTVTNASCFGCGVTLSLDEELEDVLVAEKLLSKLPLL